MNSFHVYKKYGNRNRIYFLVQHTYFFSPSSVAELYVSVCAWLLNLRFGSKDPFDHLGKLNNPEELDAYIQQTRHEQRFTGAFIFLIALHSSVFGVQHWVGSMAHQCVWTSNVFPVAIPL
jgi:hypothetical protein